MSCTRRCFHRVDSELHNRAQSDGDRAGPQSACSAATTAVASCPKVVASNGDNSGAEPALRLAENGLSCLLTAAGLTPVPLPGHWTSESPRGESGRGARQPPGGPQTCRLPKGPTGAPFLHAGPTASGTRQGREWDTRAVQSPRGPRERPPRPRAREPLGGEQKARAGRPTRARGTRAFAGRAHRASPARGRRKSSGRRWRREAGPRDVHFRCSRPTSLAGTAVPAR
jgi:hypothetical protein